MTPLTRNDKLSPMGKVLAVDWGARRVGLALSDETRTLATPLPVLRAAGGEEVIRAIVSRIREEGVDTVIVGHPLHMDGRMSASAGQANRLASRLREEVPEARVHLWDERLSSRVAAEILRERGERPGPKTKGRLDQVAAALLLQEFLDGGGR